MCSSDLPFRYQQLSDAQRIALGSDLQAGSVAERTAQEILAHLRGQELRQFRARSRKLGDIVHSTPVIEGQTIFAGANDGMLHAFDARSGDERFAYVPNLVFDHLKELSAPDYNAHHRFYVDGPADLGEVLVDVYRRHTYLVGGLGKGGKGYYCLLVTIRERSQVGDRFGPYQEIFSVDGFGSDTAESTVSPIVQWEYPQPDQTDDQMDNDGDGLTDEADEFDPDMGYSFSQAYAVNANAADNTYRPVVIFGNGYNSFSGKAVLYILDVHSGMIVRKIDTGVSGDNGLSTPALIDVDLDRRVDYAFAGDLKGNLWKFDLTAADPADWSVAYGEDLDGDGRINTAQGDDPQPLFQALNQPITARPDVMRLRGACGPQVPGFMVIFGTGKYLGASDRADVSQQSIYGIWDYGDDSDDSEHLGHLTDRVEGRLSSGLQLVPQTVVGQTILDSIAYRELSDNRVDYSTVADDGDGDGYSTNNEGVLGKENPRQYAGWFLDFPVPPDPLATPGERVTSKVAIRGGKAMVISIAPDDAPCTGGAVSWVYLLGGCYGTVTARDAQERHLPWRYDGKINDNPIIIKERQNLHYDQMVFSDSSTQIVKKGFVGEYWGKVFWRQNLQWLE